MGLIGPEMWLFIRSVSVRVADRHRITACFGVSLTRTLCVSEVSQFYELWTCFLIINLSCGLSILQCGSAKIGYSILSATLTLNTSLHVSKIPLKAA